MPQKPQKKDQEIKPTPRTDPQRETRVLMEEVRSDFKVIAEQYGTITKKLQEHDQKFDKVERRLDRVEGNLREVKGDLQVVKGQLDHLQNQVGSVLTDHEERLKTLETK